MIQIRQSVLVLGEDKAAQIQAFCEQWQQALLTQLEAISADCDAPMTLTLQIKQTLTQKRRPK